MTCYPAGGRVSGAAVAKEPFFDLGGMLVEPTYAFGQRVMERTDTAADVAKTPGQPGSLTTLSFIYSASHPLSERKRADTVEDSIRHLSPPFVDFDSPFLDFP